jgi:hypothetical protein
VNLGLEAQGQETRRLTIGPPDFGTAADNFVTYPDFDLIHARVQGMFAADPAAAGALPLERATVVAQLPSQTTDDGITEEYLQELATIGDDATLGELLSNNGQCSPA